MSGQCERRVALGMLFPGGMKGCLERAYEEWGRCVAPGAACSEKGGRSSARHGKEPSAVLAVTAASSCTLSTPQPSVSRKGSGRSNSGEHGGAFAHPTVSRLSLMSLDALNDSLRRSQAFPSPRQGNETEALEQDNKEMDDARAVSAPAVMQSAPQPRQADAHSKLEDSFISHFSEEIGDDHSFEDLADLLNDMDAAQANFEPFETPESSMSLEQHLSHIDLAAEALGFVSPARVHSAEDKSWSSSFTPQTAALRASWIQAAREHSRWSFAASPSSQGLGGRDCSSELPRAGPWLPSDVVRLLKQGLVRSTKVTFDN
ncbi:hypothetical protein FVE85_9197 [Porphyridium purpureum]|uniref:Uncharacterized protein n=1 Tax=Porphyridium purpureum TaxID=35688 RepID=A0A5J4YP10_PORPP|nr:hypothetical protein FVE85_9197 [Porphyridium purpureum]|eukprot:POR0615..scf222_8